MDQNIDLKTVKRSVKRMVMEWGVAEAHKILKRDYTFSPELQKTMLFVLYDEYSFYKFENKVKLK